MSANLKRTLVSFILIACAPILIRAEHTAEASDEIVRESMEYLKTHLIIHSVGIPLGTYAQPSEYTTQHRNLGSAYQEARRSIGFAFNSFRNIERLTLSQKQSFVIAAEAVKSGKAEIGFETFMEDPKNILAGFNSPLFSGDTRTRSGARVELLQMPDSTKADHDSNWYAAVEERARFIHLELMEGVARIALQESHPDAPANQASQLMDEVNAKAIAYRDSYNDALNKVIQNARQSLKVRRPGQAFDSRLRFISQSVRPDDLSAEDFKEFQKLSSIRDHSGEPVVRYPFEVLSRATQLNLIKRAENDGVNQKRCAFVR